MRLSRPNLHLAAARAAMRAHRNLGIDVSRRVDPFEALSRAGVAVFRRRLDHLAGAYVPGDAKEGRADGVLINAGHHPSKQRYTAAHELAHHLRDRQIVLDSDTEWLDRNAGALSAVELFAETFAAWFLMPKRLVETTLDRLGLSARNLDGQGAYALALELGTSYAATVHHLGDLGLIPTSVRRRLLDIEPAKIKRALGGNDAAADPWKDVWHVGSAQNQQMIWPVEGDAVVLTLPEIPSSGYSWQPDTLPPYLELLRSEFSAPDSQLIGGRGERRFVFRVRDRGFQSVTLAMVRPWEPEIVVDSFRLNVAAQPKPGEVEVMPELLAAAGS